MKNNVILIFTILFLLIAGFACCKKFRLYVHIPDKSYYENQKRFEKGLEEDLKKSKVRYDSMHPKDCSRYLIIEPFSKDSIIANYKNERYIMHIDQRHLLEKISVNENLILGLAGNLKKGFYELATCFLQDSTTYPFAIFDSTFEERAVKCFETYQQKPVSNKSLVGGK